MTALAANYIVNPLSRLWESIQHGFELAGYARAAAELRRLGYEKEAQKIYQTMRNLK